MAAPWRLLGTRIFCNGSLLANSPRPACVRSIRAISTSKKDRDTAVVDPVARKEAAAKAEAGAASTEKNWVSWGFRYDSKEEDENAMHALMFTSVTLCIVGVGFILMYQPDYGLRDWAQREAYLELRRREAEGLPHIDPNIVDPSKFDLPSDEELADTDIII